MKKILHFILLILSIFLNPFLMKWKVFHFLCRSRWHFISLYMSSLCSLLFISSFLCSVLWYFESLTMCFSVVFLCDYAITEKAHTLRETGGFSEMDGSDHSIVQSQESPVYGRNRIYASSSIQGVD